MMSKKSANSHGVGDQNWSFDLKIKNALNFPKLFPNIVDIMPESNATFFFQLGYLSDYKRKHNTALLSLLT